MSLVLTLMQSLRSKYQPGRLDKNELRFSRYGAWDFFQQQGRLTTGIITPEIRALIKRSQGNTVQVPVLDAEDVVITNTRTCTVPNSENTSKLVTLTFVTYSFGFTMIPAQHGNNDVSYQADFDLKLNKYLLKLASTLDQAAWSNLNTNRNQYFPSEITGYYPVVSNALQVTQAEKEDFFNQLESIHQTMDYYEPMHIVGSTSLGATVRKLASNGTTNAVNTAYQLDPYRWHLTNRATNGGGIKDTLVAVPEGYVGVENRNDWDSINGSRTGNGKEWKEVDVPVVNMRMGSYYYDDCADMSGLHAGTAHLSATRVEGFQWSTDVVFMNAYNSAPASRYGPVLKAEISAT